MSGGHGHVVPRPDGVKARCGGPALCSACAREKAQLIAQGPSACVFCEIVAGRSPATFLPTNAGSGVVAFRPLGPVAPSHLLFVPREHVADAATDPMVTARVMAEAADYAASQQQPFNLITSAGREATQTVFHLHVHYVPRREGDGLTLPWTGQ